MSNIYFPDEEITYTDLYFVCYMIERVARSIKQRNRYVVERIGSMGLARQLSTADTNHCLNPEQVVSDWREEYHLENGTTDVTHIDSHYADTVPSATQMGKVYARLIETVSQGQNLVQSLQEVYASPICDIIDNYNTGAYYEPSYIQVRAYRNGFF